MHRNCRLLPDNMVCKITLRNMRIANTCDPALKLLNEKITSTLNTSITFHNKITTTPKNIAKQITKTVRHATHKTNRFINRATHKLQGYNITLTLVQEARKQSNITTYSFLDKLNIRHLKHKCHLGLALVTGMFKTALNNNIIPHTWKLANIVPIPTPIKTLTWAPHTCQYLLPLTAKTLEKSLLPCITANIPNTLTQHFTVTALHTLNTFTL